jgi:hypothetical protein
MGMDPSHFACHTDEQVRAATLRSHWENLTVPTDNHSNNPLCIYYGP